MSFVLALLLAATSTATPTLDLGEQVPVAIHVSSPRGRVSRTPSAEFLAAAQAALGSDTNLVVWSMERGGVASGALDACPVEVRMACWMQSMRPSKARYLWSLGVQPLDDGRDRLLTTFVDLAQARELYRAALDSGEADWRERFEEQMFTLAITDEGARLNTGDPRSLRGYFDGVVQTRLQDALKGNSHWHPYGAIRIDSPAPVELTLDGRDLGRVGAGTTNLTGLVPGRHTLQAVAAGGTERREITIDADRATEVAFSSALFAEDPIRTGVRYGGLLVAATGAAVFVWSIARAADGVGAGCIRAPDDPPCPAIGGVTFGYDRSGAPGVDVARVDGGGVAMGPLGAALLTTGAVWSLGAIYVGERTTPPWWIALTGTVLGVVVYGALHVALD